MECLRCKEKMITAKCSGDVTGIPIYLSNKEKGMGILGIEKTSTVTCFVCPKCGYVELRADHPEELFFE